MRTLPRESCTIDEFGNLPLSIAYWGGGALHIDRGNPPLTRWIQGLPFLKDTPTLGVARADLATIETSWDLGYRFEAAHANDYHALLVRARFASLALLLLTVAGVTFWARSIAGPLPALAASALAATCPNLLAHGRLVTPDIGVACAITWAGFAAWRAFAAPSLTRAALAGLLAAAAVLAKFSSLALVPLLAAAVVAAPGAFRARAARFALFTMATLLPLFLAYGTATPGFFRGIPTPLPAPLVAGIEAQLREPPYPAYLFGVVREGGWLAYSFVALAMKTPLPILALAVAAAVFAIRRKLASSLFPFALVLLLVVALGFVTKKNVGVRYLLPVFPLLHVALAPLFAREAARGLRVASVCLALLAALLGVASSKTPLAAFNGLERFFGGKRFVLVDSNLDWGQALPDLREWMEREDIAVVQLAYFGRIDPSLYAISWRTLSTEPVAGPVAISASFAMGRPYLMRWKARPFTEPVIGWSRPDSWEWTKDLVPDAELGGGSILVWKDASTARRRTPVPDPPPAVP